MKADAKNVIKERYKFFSKLRNSDGSIDDFIEDLRKMAKSCNFGDETENLIRDAVILNINDKTLRNILFEEIDLTLDKLKTIYKTYISNLKKNYVPEELNLLQTDFSREMNSCKVCGKCHYPFNYCPALDCDCVYCKQLDNFSYFCPDAKLDSIKMNISNAKKLVKGDEKFQNLDQGKTSKKIDFVFSYNIKVEKSPEVSKEDLKSKENPSVNNFASSSAVNLKSVEQESQLKLSKEVKVILLQSSDKKRSSSVSFQEDLKIQPPVKKPLVCQFPSSTSSTNLKFGSQNNVFQSKNITKDKIMFPHGKSVAKPTLNFQTSFQTPALSTNLFLNTYVRTQSFSDLKAQSDKYAVQTKNPGKIDKISYGQNFQRLSKFSQNNLKTQAPAMNRFMYEFPSSGSSMNSVFQSGSVWGTNNTIPSVSGGMSNFSQNNLQLQPLATNPFVYDFSSPASSVNSIYQSGSIWSNNTIPSGSGGLTLSNFSQKNWNIQVPGNTPFVYSPVNSMNSFFQWKNPQ